MSESVIFEREHRGDVVRLEVATFKGRTFANLRRWYRQDGELKPSREGVTFPLEWLGDLGAAILAAADNAPAGDAANAS